MIKYRPTPILISFCALLSGYAATTNAGPNQPQVVSGDANFDNPNNVSAVNQITQNVAINWNSFNVNAGETLTFSQPNASAIALNRDFQGSPSQIFGSINANGHVFLLNTAGVLIGETAAINVGSLLVSDQQISNQSAADFENFDIVSSGGQLPFSDQDLAQGGITVEGNITTTGPNGLTLMGQYIFINDGGNTESINGDTNMNIAGSAVLVTDPSGLYGIELVDPVTQDIAPKGIYPAEFYPNGALYTASSDPGLSVRATVGNININVKYSTALAVAPFGLLPNHNTIGGTINRNVTAVAPPDVVTDSEQDIIEGTISDSLFDEPEEEGSQLIGDASNTSENNLDNIMDACQPNDTNRKDCLKKKALKRYLGKLLIGGNLPD